MRVIEQPYITPAGYRDFPFAYVYNANGLTNGNNYLDIQVPTQGDSDFILRRVVGVTNCVASAASGGRWNYKGHNRQYAFGNQSTGVVPSPIWTVVPEKRFAYNEAIWIDLYDVLKAVNACGGTPIPYAQIAFMGVKRFALDQGYRSQQSTYQYKEMPQRYEYSLTINWAAYSSGTTFAQPKQFSQQMDNFDFELLRMTISEAGQTGTLTRQDFAMTLYDPNSHQLSNAPIPQGYLNSGRATPSGQATYAAVTPVPSIVYPAGSQIKFDIQSLLCGTDVPKTYNISFEGIWRIPCR